MYRVYLDWNIISALKKVNKAKTIEELNILLDSNPQNILTPYSPAHIQDLLKGSDKQENIELIRKDLDFLDKISKQNCIQFDFKKKYAHPTIGSAHLLFDSYFETNKESFFHPSYLENLFNDTPFPSLGKLMTSAWKLTPVDIDFNKFEENPESKVFYDKYFKKTKESNNMYNLMLDFSEFYSDLNQNPEIYKKLIQIFRDQAGIDPKWISNLNEPLAQLDEILLKSKLGFGFEKLITIEPDEKTEILNNYFMKFSMEYAGLDMSGYHPDSFTKKNLFSNFTNDSHHAFYAAHCDYFVSYEKKLLKKAKAIYDKYKVETKTLLPTDFVDEISYNLKEPFNAQYLFNAINKTLEQGFIDELKEHDYKDSVLLLFRPELPILAYFNFLYLKQDKNNRSTVFLRHIYKNFSGFTFYSEIESIVNKCYAIFGSDVSKREAYNIDDRKNISENNWGGRIWLTDNYLIELTYDELSTGVQLFFEQITDEYLNELKQMH